ncbi:MAG: PadR family transcriptional regulator [Rhodomicrobium sp.]
MLLFASHHIKPYTAKHRILSMTSKRQQSRHLPAFILLLLAENPMHGGALQSALKARLPALKADSAAVYRTLQQLEKDGELQSEWNTSGSGPAIRIYQLTTAGWRKLQFWEEDIKGRMDSLQYFVTAYARLTKPGADKGKSRIRKNS